MQHWFNQHSFLVAAAAGATLARKSARTWSPPSASSA